MVGWVKGVGGGLTTNMWRQKCSIPSPSPLPFFTPSSAQANKITATIYKECKLFARLSPPPNIEDVMVEGGGRKGSKLIFFFWMFNRALTVVVVIDRLVDPFLSSVMTLFSFGLRWQGRWIPNQQASHVETVYRFWRGNRMIGITFFISFGAPLTFPGAKVLRNGNCVIIRRKKFSLVEKGRN